MSSTAHDVPGLVHEDELIKVHEGGVDSWLPFSKVKLFTNAFIKQDGKLLLGFKKRGFGQGLYNGFGGKVEPNETPAKAAARELQEESGIQAPLRKCGTLFFVVPNLEYAFHIDIFVAEEYTGTITETDEMRPEWFATDEAHQGSLPPLPYEKMWADDIYWMPMLLADKNFAGRADFDADDKLIKWWFGEAKVWR